MQSAWNVNARRRALKRRRNAGAALRLCSLPSISMSGRNTPPTLAEAGGRWIRAYPLPPRASVSFKNWVPSNNRTSWVRRSSILDTARSLTRWQLHLPHPTSPYTIDLIFGLAKIFFEKKLTDLFTLVFARASSASRGSRPSTVKSLAQITTT